ncbi:toxic anion resistance protein [Ketobacter sp. MCCC 1A13808]|uniref:toxic anion resistance protein n=1 Tax=Ketobacter sp. MCCC 1A13808 TaxID=2602738 RepID=UPI000F182556|nr:toxic anion resistance protein [Ketobacter sp. MCCC 1A13808]MVF13798.1 toxic anion resistance protein [Ketobacter sp. MCCC 1A13808]RLP54851.1 MAG: toxic anion resistance protein [Ketobacter sp.]
MEPSKAKPQALAQQEEIAQIASLQLDDIKQLPAEEAERLIQEKLAELDISNAQSIIHFGASAQAELQAISQEMLGGVRNKDVGQAGDTLREMVLSLKGFSVDELDPNREPSWWEKLVRKTKPVAAFVAKYDQVRQQIDRITDDLLQHETRLLKDIKGLDKLYEKTLDFYRELGLYISAGEEKLTSMDNEIIPELANRQHQGDGLLQAQRLRDLRALRDDLERRVHDLKLTRQVTMQSLPSIRLVQENDKSLVTRINSALVNTVPLWETQLAQAVTIQRSREAAGSIKAVNDLTNELLNKNAENLRQANREVREQNERGVFDLDAIRSANDNLILSIQESLQIADEGKRKRASAEQELKGMESQLRSALIAAKSQHRG